MSTIKAILVGSKQVKGHASNANWKQCSLALTCESVILLKSDHTYFMEIYSCTIDMYKLE